MHVRVMLEYFYPWTNSAGIYMAREKGWYEELGLDVECRTYDPLRGDSLSYLENEEVEFALFPSKRLLVRCEQGAPVRGVAAINHCGMEVIQTLTSTGITRPRDLTGKRIALNPTPRGLAMVRYLIEKDGGNPAHFTVVDSGVRELMPEDIAAGKADALFGSYWAWEVLMPTSIPQNERVVWPISDIGAPAYHSYLLGSNTHFIEKHPATIHAFLSATKRGYEAVASNPLLAAPIYEKVIPYFPSSHPAITKTHFRNMVL